MTSHPDANAFVRAILQDPAELTHRLVFADWLEETGEPSNVAWAHFIRLMAETPRTPAILPYEQLSVEAAALVPEIHAKLTISAEQLVGAVEHLWQLLPRPNITVRFAGHELAQSVIEVVPESVARENVVLPLQLVGNRLLVAMANVSDYDTIQKLTFILNKDIVPMRAEPEVILVAINYCYNQTETESVDCISYESPLVGLQGVPPSGEIFSIFHTAFRGGCNGFEMMWGRPNCIVRYTTGESVVIDDATSPEVFSYLLAHLRTLRSTRAVVEGVRCRKFDIPLLSGRRFPVSFESRRGLRGTTWFRVRFHWEDCE